MEVLGNQTKEEAATQMTNNNRVQLSGTVHGDPRFSHTVFGEGFYELTLAVNRLSSMQDLIPVTISERLLNESVIVDGTPLTIKGQFRSYNKLIDGRSKLMLTVFVREIVAENPQGNPQDNPNIIELSGYICKNPIYRTTPFNREIADLLVAVNRAYNKSDYIPAIAWGRNARFAENLKIGEKVYVSGRIQSREYQKRLDDGTIETRTAYEVSVNKLSNEVLESAFDIDDTAFNIVETIDIFEELVAGMK